MKKIMFSFLAIVLAASFSGFNTPAKDYTVDTNASELKWTGYHLAKSYEHFGFIKVKSGKLNVNKGTIESGEFVIDMTSISVADITDAEKAGKLAGHLKNADFFDVANNPEAKLVIKKTEKGANGTLKTTGDLTIRGITKPIEFETKLTEKGDVIEAVADIKVKRNEFNVLYGWTLENAMISGEFLLSAKIVAKK
jgi:polyisoprenoid-binding protein YceI